MVEIVHEAKWILDGSTVGGAILREVEGGFNMKRRECGISGGAWLRKREGGKGL